MVRPEMQNSVVRLLWAGYRRTREGWLNLAMILELHAQRVIGWAVSDRMKRDLAIAR